MGPEVTKSASKPASDWWVCCENCQIVDTQLRLHTVLSAEVNHIVCYPWDL